jgi:uncharacterized LabA/DUF88 family protein
MAEPTEGRVAVYIDFDNIVISRYGKVHPKFRGDKLKDITAVHGTELGKRLKEATVDVGAILDYASSFGLITVSRAYADWSTYVNAAYREQLIERAVDLVQLFPTTQSLKNGADIRLAIDVIEDLFRLPDITHVVVVAGDSDYIAVAQRVRRLNRYVVGIGVADSSSPSLAAACNEFAYYENLPGLDDDDDLEPEAAALIKTTASVAAPAPSQKLTPTNLLRRAVKLVPSKDDDEWKGLPQLKEQIRRIDPSFSEQALGYASFTKFLQSRHNVVELSTASGVSKVRLIEPAPSKPKKK